MKVVAALGQAAGLGGAHDMRSARNRPSRRNKIQNPHTPLTCVAPEIVAQEALYAKGFAEIDFVNFPKDTKPYAVCVKSPCKPEDAYRVTCTRSRMERAESANDESHAPAELTAPVEPFGR
jgi:hypothetical protein